jgi:hypothetical protein
MISRRSLRRATCLRGVQLVAAILSAVFVSCFASQAVGQTTLVYSFESGLEGFAPNGGGVTISQDTTGATEGTHSMKVSMVTGAFFAGPLTGNLPPALGDPPGVDFVLFDLTITEPFAGTFNDAGITIFGVTQPEMGGAAVQAQFFDNPVSVGNLDVGTHEIRMDLSSAVNPVTFESGQSFDQIFGTLGSGANDVIPTGFEIYFNKSQDATWNGYIDNIRVGINPPPQNADFNDDGQVNGADLTIWKNAFGQTASGDANGDTRSDGADFLIWQRQLGPAFTGGITAVPEPATGVLCFGSFTILALGRAAARHARRRAA